jgi:hypothetical protein
MNHRWLNVVTLVLFLVAVPPRLLLWCASPDSGCSPAAAALIAGVPALAALVLLPFAWRGKLWPFRSP